MGYTPLKHAWKLPYSDDSFDRIISCGVLEHVPLLNASLQELHRVTDPGGYLLITFLPNRLSYTEFVSRHVIKRSWHQRLYSKRRLKTKLLEHGFEPIEMGFHQVLPSFTAVHASRGVWAERTMRTMFKLDPLAERIWPVKLFAANIYAIARRCEYL
jgi:SAM-dependent methyltransferase